MFLGLLPPAHMDLRSPTAGLTTASDAWLLGGVVAFRGEAPEVPESGIVCAQNPVGPRLSLKLSHFKIFQPCGGCSTHRRQGAANTEPDGVAL